jgi:hypothetical protein
MNKTGSIRGTVAKLSVLVSILVLVSMGYSRAQAPGNSVFPTRVLGSIAAIGDSITAAFDGAYSEFESCQFRDNPEYSFSTSIAGNTTYSVAERASAYKGGTVPSANFGSDGARISSGDDQALAAKTWALSQAAPRLITVFLGHNDICRGQRDKFHAVCPRADQDPSNYCRTSTFYYELEMRRMLDVLVTIPDSQIAIIHPIRVSQLCNFANEKVIDEWWLTVSCEDLWATPNLFGQDGVCPSLTSCSAERIADAYTTWAAYRDIGNRLVEEYNVYASGQTIPQNPTFGTGGVVRADNVSFQTTDVIGNSRFKYRDPFGNVQLSVCECYHPSKYGQNLLAKLLWRGLVCSAATPCCNDNMVGDSDYNKGLCNNFTTSGLISGPWPTTLTVVKAGSGTGGGTRTPAGIDCGNDCAEPYTQGSVVTLIAQADPYSAFTGWSGGGCIGTGECVVTMIADATIVATFVSDPPILTTPNGGEVLLPTTSITVAWSAPPTMTKFKLFYSVNGGATWTARPTGFITGTSATWTVPRVNGNKRNSLVRVVGFNDANMRLSQDTSDGPFTIEVLKLVYPNGGEPAFSSGQAVTITWTTHATKRPVNRVRLFYTLNNGLSWRAFVAQPPAGSNPGSHAVRLPTVRNPKLNCKVKVVLEDAGGINIGHDVSDGVFTISP